MGGAAIRYRKADKMLYTAELTKSATGAPVESLDATFIEAAGLEEAKRAAIKWAEEKAISSTDGTLALQLVRRGRCVFTYVYREQLADRT
jgi:hypothetical protein